MTDTSNTNPKAWMEDVNDTLDILTDQITSLQGKSKTTQLIAAGALLLGGIQGLGIVTLFKGQKALVDTLQAVVNRIEPAPMSPEDIARAQAAMNPNLTVDNHKADANVPTMQTVTEVPSDVAKPTVVGNASDEPTQNLPPNLDALTQDDLT